MQARIASWKADNSSPGEGSRSESELEMAKPQPPPEKFPEMPWKKKPAASGGSGKET